MSKRRIAEKDWDAAIAKLPAISQIQTRIIFSRQDSFYEIKKNADRGIVLTLKTKAELEEQDFKVLSDIFHLQLHRLISDKRDRENRLRRETDADKRYSRRSAFTPSEIRLMADLYKSGLTASQVAEKMNCNRTSVVKRLKAEGYEVRSGKEAYITQRVALSQGEMIQSFVKRHGEKYDYSKVQYTHSKRKIIVTCRVHGDFEIIPNAHQQGQGCRKCGRDSFKEKVSYKFSDFVEKATRVHGGKYDYSKSEFRGWGEDIAIVCPIHGEIVQNARGHARGYGCKACADKERPGGDSLERFLGEPEYADSSCYFYVADIDKDYIKPGITNNPKNRKRQGGYGGYLYLSPALSRAECWVIEQLILEETVGAGPLVPRETRLLSEGGMTELRRRDSYEVSWYEQRFNYLLDALHVHGWLSLYLDTEDLLGS